MVVVDMTGAECAARMVTLWSRDRTGSRDVDDYIFYYGSSRKEPSARICLSELQHQHTLSSL